jgi:hypothetical protein
MLFLVSLAVVSLELYERLGLAREASAREIKKAWHLIALRLHPDKVEGSVRDKEEATQRFKAAAEAYEVLSEPSLRARYDASGIVPDDKAKSDAHKSSPSSEEEDFGFESDAGRQQQQRGGAHFGFGWRFDAFEVGLAQQRAKRVRTLDGLRRLLQPASGARFGLVGFYRRGADETLKKGLRFPYPFAGWSLAAAGEARLPGSKPASSCHGVCCCCSSVMAALASAQSSRLTPRTAGILVGGCGTNGAGLGGRARFERRQSAARPLWAACRVAPAGGGVGAHGRRAHVRDDAHAAQP